MSLMSLTDEELHAEWKVASRFLRAISDEKERRHEEKYPQEHLVYIIARGCETTRECYCTVTDGQEHTEGESPWIGMDGAPNYR